MKIENSGDNIIKKSSHKRLIAAFVIIPLFIIAALVFIWFTQEEPKPDPASEKIIREAAASQLNYQLKLNKKPNELTDEDFAKITSFTLESKMLSDFWLLEKFVNLQILHLEKIRYRQSAIPKWKRILLKIPFVRFSQDNFFDLSPLKRSANLQLLNLMGTPINNLSPIKGLKKLQALIITHGQIFDLKPLRELTNLETLFLDTGGSDLEALQYLQKLERCFLFRSEASSLEPLKKLTNLKSLGVQDCKNITAEQTKDLQKALPNLKINDISAIDFLVYTAWLK